jgi:Domain of unknown function (DUF4389)
MDNRSEPRTENVWLRLVFMVLFAMAFNITEFVMFVVACLQFLSKAITGRILRNGAAFGQSLATYAYDIVRFLTFRTEDMPWPFAPWPDGAPQDARRRAISDGPAAADATD